jgi:excisionase family DNA binding protein
MTYRTSNKRKPGSMPSSPIAGADTRARPLTKLRTSYEAAELFNTSTRTVRRLIDSGALPVHRLGRAVRISDADISVFLAASRSS